VGGTLALETGMRRTGGRCPARALGAPHACATRSRRDVQTALQAGNPAVRYCRWRLLLLREVLERVVDRLEASPPRTVRSRSMSEADVRAQMGRRSPLEGTPIFEALRSDLRTGIDAAMRLRSSRGADCAPPAHVRVEVVDGELTVEEAWDLVG